MAQGHKFRRLCFMSQAFASSPDLNPQPSILSILAMSSPARRSSALAISRMKVIRWRCRPRSAKLMTCRLHVEIAAADEHERHDVASEFQQQSDGKIEPPGGKVAVFKPVPVAVVVAEF